jgi:hypothetical protein
MARRRIIARFRAVMVVFVPEAAGLSETEWDEAAAIIDRALAGRPAGVRRQISLFFGLLDLLSLVRHGHAVPSLSVEQRRQLLERLERSRLLLLRRGVWGLRTLAFMGYYARPAAATALGYRATAAGWSARANEVRR